MVHKEHVDLIKKGVTHQGGVWADLGAGDGAFTLALRDLAGPEVEIYSIDKDDQKLHYQKQAFDKKFPQTNIQYLQKDFTKTLNLPQLDGIVMANSLHYVQHQHTFLTFLTQHYLKPGGKLILIEYNIDDPNHWVPYPLSYKTFETLAKETGFSKVKLLEKIPSSYWEEMYSAEAE